MTRRRLLISGTLLLVCGAIVNVAVAWGCAICIDVKKGEHAESSSQSTSQFLVVARWCRPGAVRFVWSRRPPSSTNLWEGEPRPEVLMPRWIEANLLELSNKREYRRIDGRGWPLPAVWLEYMHENENGFMKVTGVKGGLNTGLRSREVGQDVPLALPLRPIWPGFAINTIFYAAIQGVMFFAPGIVKRTLRCKRGLCPACAYPAGTSTVCTECGKSLSGRSDS